MVWVLGIAAQTAMVVVEGRCRTWFVRKAGGHYWVEAAASAGTGSLVRRVLLVPMVESRSVEACSIVGLCQAPLHGSMTSASGWLPWVVTWRVDLLAHFCSAAGLALGWVVSPERVVVEAGCSERLVTLDAHLHDASWIQGFLDRFQLLSVRQRRHKDGIQFPWAGRLGRCIVFARN